MDEAYKSLKLFLRGKKAATEIKESELNGIYGLLGMRTGKSKACKPNGLSGVVSSEDLMNMDLETIGLTGKFKQLIGIHPLDSPPWSLDSLKAESQP